MPFLFFCSKNYIFIGVGLEADCRLVTCEKYRVSGLENSLAERGWKRNYRHEKYFNEYTFKYEIEPLRNINAGSSQNDVAVVQFFDLEASEITTFELIRKYDAKCFVVILTDRDETCDKLRNYILINKSLIHI